MGESPPPGYQGGSILETPSVPVVMHKFHGGGTVGVSVGTDTRENVGIQGASAAAGAAGKAAAEGKSEGKSTPASAAAGKATPASVAASKSTPASAAAGKATPEDINTLTFRGVALSDIQKDPAYTNIFVLQLTKEDAKEPYTINTIPIIPVKIPFQRTSLEAEVHDTMINECFLYGEGATSELTELKDVPLQVIFYSDLLKPVHKLSELLKKLGTSSASTSVNISNSDPSFAEPKTILLSNKLRVRWIPSDDSLKEAIMNHEFTDNEQVLFSNYLHFDKPFIVKYLRADPNKEDFYNFWKLYVNHDYTRLRPLILKTDGIRVQDFLRKIHKMYVEYLKVKRSQYIGPESKRPYPESLQDFLFEHPEPSKTDVKVGDEFLESAAPSPAPSAPASSPAPSAPASSPAPSAPAPAPSAPALGPQDDTSTTNSNSQSTTNSNSQSTTNSNSQSTTNSNSQSTATTTTSNTNSKENDDDCKTVDPTKVQGREIRKYIVALLKDPSKKPEQLIMSVIAYLNSKIKDTKTYITKFTNTQTPISVSNARITTTAEKFIQDVTATMRGCPGLNYTLKQLVAVNISTFTKANKAAFINFFKKVTDESLYPMLDKRMTGGTRRKKT